MIPVITIDGPSGSGKGTIAQRLAKQLGWHFLDSGVLYRAVGWAVLHAGVDPNNHAALEDIIQNIQLTMQEPEIGDESVIYCNNHNVTDDIRSEECARMASITSAIPLVRAVLLNRQRQMRQLPGLVTDGRDMGTVVFPDATLKFYFLASVEERARRRYEQLKRRGKNVNLRDIQEDLRARDERDTSRSISPLRPASNVIMIDTTLLSIEGVFQAVWQHAQAIL